MSSAHLKRLRKDSESQRIADQERISEANSRTERGTKIRDYADGVVVRINGSEEECQNYGGAIENGTVVLVSRSTAGASVTGIMGTNG